MTMTDTTPQAACSASHPLDGMACEVPGPHDAHAYTPFAGDGKPVTWTDADQAAAATAQADARLYTLAGHIAALAGAGYEVAFTPAGAHGIAAHVEKPGNPDAGSTALGKTAAAALWAASPLHGDDVPFAVTDEGGLDASLDDFNDRLNALEDHRDKFDHVEAQLIHIMVGLLVESRPDSDLARGYRKDTAEYEARVAAEKAAAADSGED